MAALRLQTCQERDGTSGIDVHRPKNLKSEKNKNEYEN
jgi:hypothetical protein